MTVQRKKGGKAVLKLFLVLVLIGVFVAGYFLGRESKDSSNPADTAQAPDQGEKKAARAEVTWTCSMHPQIRLPEPGKCPICFMDLIPLTRDTQAGEAEVMSLRQISMSPLARKLAEVSVEPGTRAS